MSKLEELSAPFRKCEVARNNYNFNDEYNAGNADALSTGDELGKGENNGCVGSATDIKKRKQLIAKNCYNYNREYNQGTA